MPQNFPMGLTKPFHCPERGGAAQMAPSSATLWICHHHPEVSVTHCPSLPSAPSSSFQGDIPPCRVPVHWTIALLIKAVETEPGCVLTPPMDRRRPTNSTVHRRVTTKTHPDPHPNSSGPAADR